MREHGEPEAEAEADRHGDDREEDRRPEAVEEVLRAEDIADLVEPDVDVGQPGERRRAIEREVEVLEERIEDEDREGDERRREQQVGKPGLPQLAPTA